MSGQRSSLLGLCGALLLTVTAPIAAAGQEAFRATVVPDGNPLPRTWEGASALTPMQITVDLESWSTPQEIRAVKAALELEGEAAVAQLLREARVGRIVPPPHVSWGAGAAGSGREPTWRIALASMTKTPDSQIVVLVTDRPLDVFETSTVRQDPPDTPLRLGAIRLTLDRTGHAEGQLFPQARIRLLEGGGLELEDAPAGAISYSVIEVAPWTP